jgi:hypothetical protein
MLFVFLVGAMAGGTAWTASHVMRGRTRLTYGLVATVSGVFCAYGFATIFTIGAPFVVLGLAGLAGTLIAGKERLRATNAFLAGFVAVTALLLVLPH